ncbi:MAG: CPBP family intramembrane metalloprotease [Chloroflexi bacterium]|nr:CPBP family intramembrane metalloprotease [Chloroflexota bacterium]
MRNVPISPSKVLREALIALLLVLLPNLVMVGVGLLMRGLTRQVTEAQAAGQFGLVRLLRQVGLYTFMLLPTGLWLWQRRAGWVACGWGQARPGRAVGLGVLLGAVALLLRARPFTPERMAIPNTWWALATYAVVASAEETLYRGFLQGRLEAWLGRWWGYLATALLFTAVHLPARLLGGEPLTQSLTYATVQLLPMALLFGGAMLAARHTATPTLLHLAWNWASVLRSG